MHDFYSICLNLTGRTCLVVGGGKVAERKARALCERGAKVKVVSPQLTPGLQVLVEENVIAYRDGYYKTEDLADAFIVIGATDDEDTNQNIAHDCFARNILVNIVDDAAKCNFIVPAVAKQGDLNISISTGGKSPLLAKRIRERLEKEYGPEYAEFLNIMGKLRPDILTKYPDRHQRYQVFQNLIDSDLLDLIRQKDDFKIKERISQCLSPR